jgi:hypothetical protein
VTFVKMFLSSGNYGSYNIFTVKSDPDNSGFNRRMITATGPTTVLSRCNMASSYSVSVLLGIQTLLNRGTLDDVEL